MICRPGKRSLCPDSLRQSIGHRAVRERAQQPALSIHVQIASRPDGRRTYIAGKDSIVGGQLVHHLGNVLRVDRRTAGFADRKIVQPFAGGLVIIQAGIEVLAVLLILKQRRSAHRECP